MTKITKKRILTGMQASGTPHIGNYLGMMKGVIEMQSKYESYIFIADLHALTTLKDPQKLRQNIIDITIDFLALGLDPEKVCFFRHSDVPEHSELAWILANITPFGLLERAHAWKDALIKKIKEPHVGLFTYPVLMAADILLYQPEIVPVGKDQKQHVEIARELAEKFNHKFPPAVFKVPQEFIPEEVAVVPGTDGEKMSKSYGNTIDIFTDDKTLEKQVMSIKTDSTPLEAPKNPDTCLVYKTYAHFASDAEKAALRTKYEKGGMGYGDAKKILLAKLKDYFAPYRQKRVELAGDLGYVEKVLQEGAKKAQKVARKTLDEVKKNLGLII